MPLQVLKSGAGLEKSLFSDYKTYYNNNKTGNS